MRRSLCSALACFRCTCAVASSPADLKRSENLFRAKCANCHSVACNRLGPKLEGVFGRKAGAVEDFKGYSDALRNSGIVWDDKTLDAFLRDSTKLVAGNVMVLYSAPLPGERERRDLIAHMRRQDRKIDLC